MDLMTLTAKIKGVAFRECRRKGRKEGAIASRTSMGPGSYVARYCGLVFATASRKAPTMRERERER